MPISAKAFTSSASSRNLQVTWTATAKIKSSPDHQAPAVLQPDFDLRVARYVGRGFRHLHFHESRRSVFPQPFLPPEEMRRAQLPLSAERRHTLPASLKNKNRLEQLRNI